MHTMDSELRKKNVRLAWILAAFAVFILVTAVPFWSGLVKLGTGGQ